MGVLVEDLLTLARLDEVRRRRRTRRSTSPRSPRDAVDDARATAPDRAIELHVDEPARRHRRRRTSCARCSPTCCATRSSTRPPGTPIEVAGRSATASVRARGPRPRPGPADRATPTRCSSASGAPRAGASAASGGAGLGLAIVAGDRRRPRRRRARRQRARRRRALRRQPAAGRLIPSDGSQPRSQRGPQRRAPTLWPCPSRRSPALASARAGGPAPRPRRTSTSSSPSTTRRPAWSAASAGCTASCAPSFPFTLADRDRRQREHRRHAGDRAGAGRRAARRRASCGSTRKGRGRALRAAWSRSDARGRLLHGRRPLDRPARRCCRSSRRCCRATATSPSARGWRARRARRARPQARADLARLQPPAAHRAARALLRRPVRLQGGARRRRARRCSTTSATTAGSSTPSCWCSPSGAGCGSTRCRSTGSTTPTRAWTSSRTALDDLRGVARLLADGPVARFMGIGVLSTLAYALLFLLLRGPLGAGGANALALALTAVANTAANRRLTFGVRGRERARAPSRARRARVRPHARADDARARVLHRLDATPARALELGVLVVAAHGGDRHPLRRAAHVGVRAGARRARRRVRGGRGLLLSSRLRHARPLGEPGRRMDLPNVTGRVATEGRPAAKPQIAEMWRTLVRVVGPPRGTGRPATRRDGLLRGAHAGAVDGRRRLRPGAPARHHRRGAGGRCRERGRARRAHPRWGRTSRRRSSRPSSTPSSHSRRAASPSAACSRRGGSRAISSWRPRTPSTTPTACATAARRSSSASSPSASRSARSPSWRSLSSSWSPARSATPTAPWRAGSGSAPPTRSAGRSCAGRCCS